MNDDAHEVKEPRGESSESVAFSGAPHDMLPRP